MEVKFGTSEIYPIEKHNDDSLITDEVDVGLGLYTAAVMSDMQKFYDSIQPLQLLRAAIGRTFPKRTLVILFFFPRPNSVSILLFVFRKLALTPFPIARFRRELLGALSGALCHQI